jgi:hypothetical protein
MRPAPAPRSDAARFTPWPTCRMRLIDLRLGGEALRAQGTAVGVWPAGRSPRRRTACAVTVGLSPSPESPDRTTGGSPLVGLIARMASQRRTAREASMPLAMVDHGARRPVNVSQRRAMNVSRCMVP